MSFVIRSVRHDDITQLMDLARQFTLLNLPADKRILSDKIERSLASFEGGRPKHKSEYLFVAEDLEESLIVGSSLILGKHGTEEIPHSFFRILKKNHFSEDLGIGFIHQVLRFQIDMDGPSEIGGLLVDKLYRRRLEKIGKQISLARFLYVGMFPERFESRVLCELTPPLTDEGRSEFWEALGRRFTGLPYQEADMLSQSHREFIRSLFPEEDIYLCLLDAKARTVLGRVGEHTKPAQHLLESIGFTYQDEVDPFDGGPHFGCDVADIGPVALGKWMRLTEFSDTVYREQGLMAVMVDGEFRCALVNYDKRGDEVAIPPKSQKILGIESSVDVYLAPFHYAKGGKEQI